MSIEKIKDSEIYANSMQRVGNRPSAAARYGTGGLSAEQIKAKYDALAMLAINKINEFVDAAKNGEFKGEEGKDGITPHIGANGNWWLGDQDTGVFAGGDGGSSDISIDNTLKYDQYGKLGVNTASAVEKDNTLPITSAAVETTVGNIEILLRTI